MPELEIVAVAKCDHDQQTLECSGGYLSNSGNFIIVYTCPECHSNYLLLDGEFIQGSWRIIDTQEALQIQMEQVNK